MGRVEIGRFLLSLNVGIDNQNGQGNTPLHMACAEGEEGMVKLLIEYEADACLLNDNNLLPVDVATVDGVKSIVAIETRRQQNRNNSCLDMINTIKSGVLKVLPIEIAIMILERICTDIMADEFIILTAAVLNRNLLRRAKVKPKDIFGARHFLVTCKELLQH
jgi:ankyrin repeat protein